MSAPVTVRSNSSVCLASTRMCSLPETAGRCARAELRCFFDTKKPDLFGEQMAVSNLTKPPEDRSKWMGI